MWGKNSIAAGFVAKGVSRDMEKEKTWKMVRSPDNHNCRIRQ